MSSCYSKYNDRKFSAWCFYILCVLKDIPDCCVIGCVIDRIVESSVKVSELGGCSCRPGLLQMPFWCFLLYFRYKIKHNSNIHLRETEDFEELGKEVNYYVRFFMKLRGYHSFPLSFIIFYNIISPFDTFFFQNWTENDGLVMLPYSYIHSWHTYIHTWHIDTSKTPQERMYSCQCSIVVNKVIF